jgi:excisionase family DNA binding protein
MVDHHNLDRTPRNPALTVGQVADQLGTSSRTVQRWIKDGRLRAVRLPGGRSYRVYQQDVDDALEVIEASA